MRKDNLATVNAVLRQTDKVSSWCSVDWVLWMVLGNTTRLVLIFFLFCNFHITNLEFDQYGSELELPGFSMEFFYFFVFALAQPTKNLKIT